MKRILFFSFIMLSCCCGAQSDTAQKEIAIAVGGSFGGGVSTHQPALSYNYGALMHEENVYLTYTAYAAVLFREKMGFRATWGHLGGSTAASATIDDYAAIQFPGYHYLPEYSELHAGYHYQYVVPQAVYRLGDEPFNITLALGAGIGRIHTPHGTAILQKDGSNDFIELTYHSQNMWNMHGQLDVEFGYMRQLSQHVFANVGLYTTSVALMSNYEFHYTETDYGQTYSVSTGGQSDDLMMHFNAGIFLNLQWNKRESPRAYYE
jgi:hypothetical protein